MKDLTDLAQIVTKTKLRSVELIGNDTGEGTSKLQEFYDLVSEGRFADDDEAAEHFYGKGKGKNHPSYQKLRKTLKDRLVNSLFVIDLKQASYSSRQKAYYEAYKEWGAAKILFGKNARTAAAGLGRKLLKIARKSEFTELVVDICHTLRLYHGTIEGDYKKYQQYNEEFKHYEQLWIAENRAEEFYIDLSIGFINSKATKTDFKDKALEYYEQVREAMDTYDSYQLHLCGRLIEVSIHTSVNEYEETIGVCDRAIAFFEKKSFTPRIPLQVFLYQKFICHVQLRQFEAAKAAAKACLPYLEEGAFNWLRSMSCTSCFTPMTGNTNRPMKFCAWLWPTPALTTFRKIFRKPGKSPRHTCIFWNARGICRLPAMKNRVAATSACPGSSMRWRCSPRTNRA